MALNPRERHPVLIVEEAGRARKLVWPGTENLASTGVRSQDRPARSGSLQVVCSDVCALSS